MHHRATPRSASPQSKTKSLPSTRRAERKLRGKRGSIRSSKGDSPRSGKTIPSKMEKTSIRKKGSRGKIPTVLTFAFRVKEPCIRPLRRPLLPKPFTRRGVISTVTLALLSGERKYPRRYLAKGSLKKGKKVPIRRRKKKDLRPLGKRNGLST